MPRGFGTALTAMFLLSSFASLANGQDKKDSGPSKTMTITRIDAGKGTLAVKYTDDTGKTQEKTYHLTEEVRILDETGRQAHIGVFQTGDEVLFVETEGKLHEVRRSAPQSHRVCDTVRTLIELAEANPNCAADLQSIYDVLRKLDTGKNGKIDVPALKAEADRLVQERVKRAMTRLDSNNDGKISKEEARGLIKEHFDMIDTNKDGLIEFNELLQAAKERREREANATGAAPDKQK